MLRTTGALVIVVMLARFFVSRGLRLCVIGRSGLGRTQPSLIADAVSKVGYFRSSSALFSSATGTDTTDKIDYFSVPAEANENIEYGD